MICDDHREVARAAKVAEASQYFHICRMKVVEEVKVVVKKVFHLRVVASVRRQKAAFLQGQVEVEVSTDEHEMEVRGTCSRVEAEVEHRRCC